MSAAIAETREAGGTVLTCACSWLRWFPNHPDADAGRREHVKRCKVARGEVDEVTPAPVAKARPKTSWNDREGATWIDQM